MDHTVPSRRPMFDHMLAACLLSLCGAATAASFDCAKARTDVEKAVCASTALSAKDERLAELYKKLLAGSPGQLRAGQREWLSALPGSCLTRDSVEACLVDAYDKRNAVFAGLLELRDAPGAAAQATAGYGHAFKAISKKHDFVLQLLDNCEMEPGNTSGSCEAPGVVSIFEKGGAKALQAIPMENIFVSFNQRDVPLANSAKLYDYQGVINVGDFNFDGEEDFAIQNGNSGSYGGPSYDVYLATPKGTSFVFSPDLTELIASTLGFFKVDAKGKRLSTFAKSGCCYHESTIYQVVRNMPLAVSRSVDEAGEGGGVVHQERMEGGKWKRVSTRRYRQ